MPAGPLVPAFALEIRVDADQHTVWSRLWDLDRHTAAIPATVVRPRGPGALRHGSLFIARTRLGPLRLDDRMAVSGWSPPHRARIDKHGPVVRGQIEAEVIPEGEGSVVRWQQRYAIRGVPDVVAALGAPLARAAYASALRRLLEGGRGANALGAGAGQ